ncbi:MAG: hypothetical protein KGZ40_03765 [Clostridiales bacterium]|nr:hypothetical protein [Clostridiales bacterium]
MTAAVRQPFLARILPSSLRSRLTLTVLLANVALVVVGTSVFLLLFAIDRPNQIEHEARQALRALAYDLEAQTELVETIGVSGAISPNLIDLDDPAALSLGNIRLAALVDRTVIDAAALVTADGRVVAHEGAPYAVAAITSHVDALGAKATSGLIAVGEDGVAVISLTPLSASTGSLAVLRMLDTAGLPSRHPLTFTRTYITQPGDTVLAGTDTEHLGITLFTDSPDGTWLRAELRGIDERSVGWISASAEADRGAADVLTLSLLVAAGLAVIAGLLVGVGLTILIRRPLETLVGHVRHHGHAALEGHAVAPLAVDPWLPSEMRTLAEVYESLLDHLARKQAEATEAASALRFAVDDSFEAKILVRDGQVALVNAAASALFGLPAGRSQVAFSSFLDSLTIESETGESLSTEELLLRALDRVVVAKFAGPGIPTRWAELRAVEHDDPRRTTLLTGRDVTERLRVDAIRDEIVSLVTHDLRAPLTVIGGYLDLLERPLPDASRLKAAGAARRSAERMGLLLEDLLCATRAEELFSPVMLEPVSLSDLAEETVTSFEHTTEHTLSVTLEGRGVVLGEERRLRQALVNLVSNAIKHTPPSGTIRILVEPRGDRITVAVHDDGPGIPQSEREIIFERFARLREAGENRPGIGLGLYIVRAIIESHGGTVKAEARPDGERGARFVIDLPAA